MGTASFNGTNASFDEAIRFADGDETAIDEIAVAVSMFMMSYEDLHDIDLEPVVTASYTTRTVFISFTTPGETAGAAFANGADAIADLFRMLDARPGAHVAGWRSCIPEMLTA